MPSEAAIERKWYVVDATGYTLGRLSSEIAKILRGKNKTYYTPFLDCGDNVVVINCGKLIFSGKKMEDKSFLRHNGYPGGQRLDYVRDLIKTNPSYILLHSVKGMLPKNRLGRKLLKNIRCFNDEKHNLSAQNPEKIVL